MSGRSAIVLLDACVLYPAGLRNLMMWLAVHGLIRPKWREQIHEEWTRNVLTDRPDLTREQLLRTRRLMDEHAGDCLVSGHERHIESLHLPDEDDRHVLAAAIESGADAIVTWNLGDFPADVVSGYGIMVVTPDDLLIALIDEAREGVWEAMAEHRASLKNPARSPREYLEDMERQGLTRSVDRIRDFQQSL